MCVNRAQYNSRAVWKFEVVINVITMKVSYAKTQRR